MNAPGRLPGHIGVVLIIYYPVSTSEMLTNTRGRRLLAGCRLQIKLRARKPWFQNHDRSMMSDVRLRAKLRPLMQSGWRLSEYCHLQLFP